jgi:hypothetical protein
MWTSPSDLQDQVQRRWDNGSLLASLLNGEPLFPLRLSLKRPSTNDLATNFDSVRDWIRELESKSHATLGYGYDLEWTDQNHRQLGRNRVPSAAYVKTREGALRMIGRSKDAEVFSSLCTETLAQWPVLSEWIIRRPLRLLECSRVWPQVLALLRWFSENQSSGLYLRQIDVVGVDTKFIETYRTLLLELLQLCLPDSATNTNFPPGPRSLEARYGLTTKPTSLRLRLLDPTLSIGGFTDLCAPVAQWNAIDIDLHRVFITENEINGLCFPMIPRSAVIFGLGYGLERLTQLPWLSRAEVTYWGDIDTHGFAMLDRLRALLPHARSLLMDRETLFQHRSAWAIESSALTTDLTRLNPDESALFDELRRHHHGEGVRLEQERIRFGWVQEALLRLTPFSE